MDLRMQATAAAPVWDQARILHVMTRYLRGGSERRLHDMVRAVPEARHELVVGRASQTAVARGEIELASLRVVPSLVRQPSPVDDVRALASIRRIMHEASPDIVVTHQSKAGALARLCAREAHVPSVSSLSMANFGPGYPRAQSHVYRALERALQPTTAAYAVVGRDLARRFEAIGVPSVKLHIVRSGVPLPARGEVLTPSDDVRRWMGIPTDRPLVAYVGSLEPRKRVLDLPDLLRGVRGRSQAEPFLAVAGEGPLEATLRGAILRADLERDAAVLGFVESPLPLIAAADAVVLLSHAEGVSQVLVQAAAVDTPFVAYDVDGVGELIAMGARGRTVAIDDVAAAARAVADVIGWPRSAPLPSIDLAEWSTSAIDAGYRRLFTNVLTHVATVSPT